MCLVTIATAGLCLAAPVDNDVSKDDDYNYGHSEEDPSFIYQEMILPGRDTLPKEFFGPEYVWDTKGFPRRAEVSQSQVDTGSVSSIRKNQKAQKLR